MQPVIALAPGVSREYLLHNRLCPVGIDDDGTMCLATAGEVHPSAIDELSVAYERPVRTEPRPDVELDRLIERLANGASRASDIEGGFDVGDIEADVRDLMHQPPVVRYVNLLIQDACAARASDIHLEAIRGDLLARFRIDGVLVSASAPPPQLQHAVVSRIKLLAELDIAERRRPQDGRIRARLDDREVDMRVATIPTMHGESVVLRLLDQGGRPARLEELGFGRDRQEQFARLAKRPQGMLLVTGPTGAGKTTTLYSALQLRDSAREKVITVEDPVEYHLPGVTQVPIHRQTGVNFAAALRAILRQDPDVLMVGEMRDGETAEVAVQAAMTGHVVFSTLHTNDALGAVGRMIDLGVPDYLVAATLSGVLAQRLVRRICEHCRVEYEELGERVARLIGAPSGGARLFRGAGCARCRDTGHAGRVGVFELLVVTDSLREAICRGATASELRGLAESEGFKSLRQDGTDKVFSGITSIEEVLRVIQD